MTKDPIIYINHILECVEKIESYTSNVSARDFLENELIQDAVIRNFEIIGEATKQLQRKISRDRVEENRGYARQTYSRLYRCRY